MGTLFVNLLLKVKFVLQLNQLTVLTDKIIYVWYIQHGLLENIVMLY